MVRKVEVNPVKLWYVYDKEKVSFCNFKQWLGLKGYKIDAENIISASRKKVKKLNVRLSI